MPYGKKIFPNMSNLEYYLLGFGDNLLNEMSNQNIKFKPMPESIIIYDSIGTNGELIVKDTYWEEGNG